MELSALDLDDRYRTILDTCHAFVISYPANWPALDLTPFGVTLAKERRFTATRLHSRDVIDGLHHLDGVTFSDQDMLMPRWVLFDCGEFPGIVFGFGRLAKDLPQAARKAYQVEERDDVFVPLSMWVAIPCAEDGAWFGHNLSSANLILKGDDALPGLATLTKIVGVKLTKATKQYGATQWSSSSIGLHLRLGAMEVLSAYTPAHTHAETLAYRVDVDDEQSVSSLRKGWKADAISGERTLDADDSDAIRKLHDELEAGARWQLQRAERRDGAQRLHLCSLP